MIRIDEIYNNVFLPRAMKHTHNGDQYNSNYQVGLHWFQPFGTTEFENIISQPSVIWKNPSPEIEIKNWSEKEYKVNESYPNGCTRVIFWDQEPVHRYRFNSFIEPFLKNYVKQDTLRIVTSEYNSEDIEWACDTYGLVSDYYFFHGWAALDWYRGYNRTSIAQKFSERNPYNTFLCPNNIIGGERRHRIELLNELVNRNLLDKNLISFPDVCPYEGQSLKALCKKYNLSYPNVRLPLMIDNGAGHAAKSHQIDLWDQANNSLIHVVTETVYKGNKNHLTEKTFKPIVMQQPFIIQSCRGSLEYLRRYGFKTFSEFWDESYDELPDETRTKAIGQLMQDINTMSQKEKALLQSAVSNTVKHNYEWFYGEQFEKILWDELSTMIDKW
jgi:hypothetical protein